MIDNIHHQHGGPVLLFAYGNYHDENKYKKGKRCNGWRDKELKRMSLQNGFQQLGVESKNAFDSESFT